MRLTKEQIKEEIRKCGQDPIYFLKNYVRIAHPLRGVIPFTTYDFQDDLLKDFNDYRFNIVLKARQLGISTIVAGYAAWLMLFRREKTVLVVATKFKTAANLVVKVKKMIKSVPDWLRISEITIDNQASFELANGSQIKASTTSKNDSGRSEALSLLIVDEAAFVENMEDLWTGIKPTITTGGRCIALSTPNGVGNWFYKTYVGAEAGTNDFHHTMLPWDVHPDRDENWFQEEIRNMDRRKIAQEYECAFNMSGETVVNPDDIERMKKYVEAIDKEPIKTGFDRNYWIWENPIPGQAYVVSVDVARGDGNDYSVFHVMKITSDKMEQVAEYQGKMNHDMFAIQVAQAGKEYGHCLIIVENNMLGFNVLDKLIAMEYPNLYWSSKGSHEYVDQFTAETSDSGIVPGFTTTMKTRPLIIAKMEEFIRNRILVINSTRTIREMETFVWNNGKPEALRGYNDDLILALSIACWVKETALTENKREAAYTKALLAGMMKANTNMNTKIPGMYGYSSKTSIDPYAREIKETMAAFPWIFKG